MKDVFLLLSELPVFPDQIRKYAYLAERITNLLIREQELNQYSRREADKKHFVLQL